MTVDPPQLSVLNHAKAHIGLVWVVVLHSALRESCTTMLES